MEQPTEPRPCRRWGPWRFPVIALLGCVLLGAQIGLTAGDAAPPAAPPPPLPEGFPAAMTRAAAYLRAAQNPDGSWGQDAKSGEARGNLGITALCLYSLAVGPEAETLKAGELTRAAAWLLKNQNDDGAFTARGEGNENYYTSTAVLALTALDRRQYAAAVTRAVKYLTALQCDEELGYDPDRHPDAYGGQGYGSVRTPDLGNTIFYLEALTAAGHPATAPEFKHALVFLRRCQASAEVNDREWALNIDPTRTDKGGAIYAPNRSEAGTVIDKRTGNKSWRAYGSMSCAMLKAYLDCGLKPDSPELIAAFQFVRTNYTLEQNPGLDQNGLFFYYLMLSRALNAYGQATGSQIVRDSENKPHDWRLDLAAKLIARQRPDGSYINTVDRWWEQDPQLATAYALLCGNQILSAHGGK